jgi:hypothetical protein
MIQFWRAGFSACERGREPRRASLRWQSRALMPLAKQVADDVFRNAPTITTDTLIEGFENGDFESSVTT